MEVNPVFVCFLVFASSTWTMWNGVFGCTAGLDPIGWIIPYEDKVIHVGDSFRMMCVLSTTQTTFPNATSRDLRFLLNDQPVSDGKVNILNETALEYYEDNATLPENGVRDIVSCNLHDKLLCMKYVTAGYEPLPVTNFSCISNNWENLTCTWHEPPNPISTTYSLCYLPLTRAPSRCIDCPTSYSSPGSCTWPTTSYIKTPRLNFTMKMYNTLTNGTQSFPTVNHYAIMLPKQMENISVSDVTKNAGQVSWLIPANSRNFYAGLSFKASYRPTANWSKANETVLEGSELSIINGTDEPRERTALLRNLPFANARYEVKVYARSNQSENLWSQPASVILETLPDIPCRQPGITIGSFRLESPKLFVYWDPVPPECENGDDFHYYVSLSQKGNGTKIEAFNTTNSFVEFTRTYPAVEYTVSVSSVNRVGNSTANANILIPSESNLVRKPLEVTGILYSNYHLLEVTWSPSKGSNSTERPGDFFPSHTIFWCRRGASDGHCSGKLEWAEVQENITAYNITLIDGSIHDHLVFVAATRGQYSSGMEKACLINDTGAIDTVRGPTISDVTTTGWKITWIPIDCDQRKGIIDKYFIYINSEDQSYNKTVTLDNTVYSYVVTDAYPLKNYSIQMSVLSRHGEGDRTRPKSAFTKADDWYTGLAVGVTLAAVVLCTVAAIVGYRHCTILQKTKGMKAVLPWNSQSVVTTLDTEKQVGPCLAPSYQPTTVPYDRFDSVISTISTKSPLTSTFSLSDRSSFSSGSSETFPSKPEDDTPWQSPLTDQSITVFESLEQEENHPEIKEKEDTSADPQPGTEPLHQAYVMIGNSQATKPQPGYVTLGQQQEKLAEPTEPTTIATSYITLGRRDHKETGLTPTAVPGYVQLGQMGLQRGTGMLATIP